MTTYIAVISDNKVRDLLKKLKKEDSLIIYYKPNEKQVPIDMIPLFSEAKGQVEFREYGDDVAVAFETGKLTADVEKRNNAGVEIVSDSYIFGKLKLLISGGRKAKKPAPRKASETKKAEPVPEQLSLDMTVTKGSAAKTEDNGKDDEKLFDEAYADFDSLLSSLKTKAYDPLTGKQGIFNALKLMQEEKQPFGEALKKSLSASAAKKFFAEISSEDTERIKEAGLKVMKYDQ